MARLRGERGALISSISQAKGKITETGSSRSTGTSAPKWAARRDSGEDLGTDREAGRGGGPAQAN
jgi:hypothetical protein